MNEIIVGIFNSTTSLCRSASLPIYQKLEVFEAFFPSVCKVAQYRRIESLEMGATREGFQYHDQAAALNEPS